MANDFVSVHIALEFNLLQQLIGYKPVNKQLKVISPDDYTEHGSIRFQKCENMDIPKVSSLKRLPPKAAPVVKAKQVPKVPKTMLPSRLDSFCNYAVLSAASSKVDTSTLISVVQNLRTNEKEYRCSFCEYFSKDFRNARRHVELKHVDTGIIFQCKTCGGDFSLKAHLKSHYMKVHQLPEPAAKAMLD